MTTTPTLPPCDHTPAPYDGPSRDAVLAHQLRRVQTGYAPGSRECGQQVEFEGREFNDCTVDSDLPG